MSVLFHVVVLAVMASAITLREGRPEYPGAALIAFALLSWLPLLSRRRWPLATVIVVVTIECTHLILLSRFDPRASHVIWAAAYQPVPVGTMAAVFSYAARRRQRAGWIAGIGAAGMLLAVSVLTQPRRLVSTDIVMVNLVLIATAAGVALSARQEAFRRRAQQARDEAEGLVVAERLRIARDLHDVLAHHLTLVNSQAGVANYLLASDPATASVALRDITTHTRRALDELRATVGLLRQDGEPPGDSAPRAAPVPGLDRLDELLTDFRSAGNPITLRTIGDARALSGSADVAAYRIVQEALTNAARHAPGAHVEVALEWSAQGFTLSVENERAGRPGAVSPGSGHGLVGMRERAIAAGGSLDAGWTPAGRFRVAGELPLEDADAPNHA